MSVIAILRNNKKHVIAKNCSGTFFKYVMSRLVLTLFHLFLCIIQIHCSGLCPLYYIKQPSIISNNHVFRNMVHIFLFLYYEGSILSTFFGGVSFFLLLFSLLLIFFLSFSAILTTSSGFWSYFVSGLWSLFFPPKKLVFWGPVFKTNFCSLPVPDIYAVLDCIRLACTIYNPP